MDTLLDPDASTFSGLDLDFHTHSQMPVIGSSRLFSALT